MGITSRRQLNHPALGSAGGTALYAAVENLYTVLGNDDAGRYYTFSGIANSATVTYEHNFGVPLTELKVMIYTGTFPNLSPVLDTFVSGWNILPTSGLGTTKVDIVAPSSGGPFTGVVYIVHDRSLARVTGLIDGQGMVYNSTAGAFINEYLKLSSEVATIATNLLTPTSTRPKQVITSFTGSTSDLQTIANPTTDKVLLLVNETGADITVKNNVGTVAANRINTGTGLDFTLKNGAGVFANYDATLARWILVGGGGSSGRNTIEATASVATPLTNTRYAFTLSATGQTFTIPNDTSAFEYVINDRVGTFLNFPLTLVCPAGQTIATGAVGENFSCNYNFFCGTISRAPGSTKINVDLQMTTAVPPASLNQPGTIKSYDEGTFTPFYTCTGSAPSIVHSQQIGTYVKIGKLVSITMRVTVGTVSANGAGFIVISGLPFPLLSTTNYQALSIGYAVSWSTQQPISAIANPASGFIELYYKAALQNNSTALPANSFSNGCEVILSGTYIAAS